MRSILTCPLAHIGVCLRTFVETIGTTLPSSFETRVRSSGGIVRCSRGVHLFPLFRHDRTSSSPALRAAEGLRVFPYLLLRVVGAAGVSRGRGRLLSRTANERPQIIHTTHEEGGPWRTASKQWIAMMLSLQVSAQQNGQVDV